MNPITEAEVLYNESQIRSRVLIEHTFGVWKRKFPVLAYGGRLKLETMLIVIVSTGVLHNIARQMNEDEELLPDEYEHLIHADEVPDLPDVRCQRANAGILARNALIQDYFGELARRRG